MRPPLARVKMAMPRFHMPVAVVSPAVAEAPWVEAPTGENHKHFRRYPDESIEDWHRRHGLYIE